jgi:hypothetical protein
VREVDRIVEELAAEQHGAFSHAQAAVAGMTRASMHRRVESGAWVPMPQPRVFCLARYPRSWHQALWAARLWGGERSAISHRAAGGNLRLGRMCARSG